MKCTAHRTNGEECHNWAVKGARVCVNHGARAPQVREKAAQRILEMAWPAAVRMGRLIDSKNPMVALAAAKDILDRNGFKAIERVQTDGRVLIEIELVDRAAKARKVVELNGHAPDPAP
jgi:hypothetical protein